MKRKYRAIGATGSEMPMMDTRTRGGARRT